MINEEIFNYIKDCRKKGFPDADIKKSLLQAGWNQKEVLEALVARPSAKVLPKWVSIVGIILAVFIIGGFIWAAVFAINDIQKISADIANMTQQIHKSGTP